MKNLLSLLLLTCTCTGAACSTATATAAAMPVSPASLASRLQPALIQSGDVWSFTSSDGTALRGRRWLPASGKISATLIAVHGTQTHAGWFGALAAELTAQGWAVYAPDRRGSGLNIRRMANGLPAAADATDWQQWVADLDAAVGSVHAAHPAPHIHLLGSSWGTSLVSVYLDPELKPHGPSAWKPLHAPRVRSLILSVPSGLKSKVPGLGKKIEVFAIGGPLVLLGKLIPPLRRVSTTIGLPAETYSSAPATRQLIGDRDIPFPSAPRALALHQQDPEMLHRATYRFLFQSNAMRRAALHALQRLQAKPHGIPVIGLLAQVDDIASNDWLKQQAFAPGSTQTLPDTEHAVQVERADVLATAILRWVKP